MTQVSIELTQSIDTRLYSLTQSHEMCRKSTLQSQVNNTTKTIATFNKLTTI